MLHGGDLYTYSSVKYDFSTNINPYGPPKRVEEFIKSGEFFELQKRYPRIYPKKLEERLGEILGRRVLVGPGSCFFIYLIASLFSGKRVLTLSPSFIEYELAAKAYGCEVLYHRLREDMEFRVCLGELTASSLDADAVFLCNPNNPTGRLMDKEELEAFLRWSQARGLFVILDEAFVDFVDGWDVEYGDNVLVLRSFTKSYGIPGIRLGYVFGNGELLEKLKGRIPPWSLGGGVEEIGLLCLEEEDFLRESMGFIGKEKGRVFKILSERFKVFPSSANFYLFKAPKKLFSFLLDHGVLIRDCSSFRGLGKGFFRISVRRKEENLFLEEVLSSWG